MEAMDKADGWRSTWVARNWLGAMPFLRSLAAPSPRRALDEIGADLAMVTGMVVGMDLGASEVHFLRSEEPALVAAGTIEAAAFGDLLSVVMVASMVIGMGLGMLAWEFLSPRLGIEIRAVSERRRRPTSLLRRALVYFPGIRCLCEPTLGQGCRVCLGDSMMIVGMMAGVAVAHHLMSGSAGPVSGLASAVWMAAAMALGMGVGLALWNTLFALAAACPAAVTRRQQKSARTGV